MESRQTVAVRPLNAKRTGAQTRIAKRYLIGCLLWLATLTAQAAYDVTIAASGVSSGGSWVGNTWTPSASGSTVLASEVATHLGSGATIIDTAGAGVESGDILVQGAVAWSANQLTLSAAGNIVIQSDLNGSGTAQLALEFGQGAVAAGNPATYALRNGARVSLPAGGNFGTRLGSDGGVVGYTVITGLGVPGDALVAPGTMSLQGVTTAPAGNYALGADIDASTTSAWNGGAGFAPIGSFSGTLTGLGHHVIGLTINRGALAQIGLIGLLSGALSDITLANVAITGLGRVGGAVGYGPGTLSNVHVTGRVTGTADQIGGLIGWLDLGQITGSSAAVSVSGGGEVGGLVGRLRAGTITDSYATGSVTGTSPYVGGFAGSSYQGGTLTSVYASGKVAGTTDVGGLVGGASFAGAVAATNAYWDIDTTGQGASSAGTGINTGNARTQASYGFDFANTWVMMDGETRPMLRNEYSTVIVTPTALQLITQDLTASYTLAIDMNLTADFAADGGGNYPGPWGAAGFAPIGDNSTGSNASRFTGTFDGLSHTISGLLINRPGSDTQGLFGYAANVAVLRNIGLINGSVTGRNSVGVLVGQSNGAISYSYADGGAISGNTAVGGLVGGGSGSIGYSYASVGVSGTNTDVGGLAGVAGAVSNSYATGSVHGGQSVGGLLGQANGNVSKSYAAGAVTATSATNIGGLVGMVTSGTTSNSYWDITTTGQNSSAAGTGVNTTALMQTQASFASFDFASDWRIYEGHTYPLLKYLLTPLTITAQAAGKTYDGLAYSGGNGVGYSALPNANLLGTASYGGTSQGAVNVGTYSIVPGGWYSNQRGYDLTLVNGTLTVGQTALTVTANNATKYWDGVAWSGGNGVGYAGFVNNENSAVLGGTLSYGGSSQGAVAVGGHSIVPGGLTSGNYAIGFVNGTLTIQTLTSFSAPTATGTGTANVTLAGGGAGCTVIFKQFVPLSSIATPPPAGQEFAHGLFDFRLGNCAPNSTVTVTVNYPASLPPGTQYWKYGPTHGDGTPHWYTFAGAAISGNTVILTLTDGQDGDDDLLGDGNIADAGGPGAPGVGVSDIPTLSEWGLILLSLLLAGWAWREARGKSRR